MNQMGTKTAFAPMLTIRNGVTDIGFYKNAFGAAEHMRLNNDDGSVHVAELIIDGAMFHLHEIYPPDETFNPEKHSGVITLGLMTADVHSVFDKAIAAGATILSPGHIARSLWSPMANRIPYPGLAGLERIIYQCRQQTEKK